VKLRHTEQLDVRTTPEAALAPFQACVNIPLDELRGRVHELPPKGSLVRVFGEEAIKAVEALGRVAELEMPAPGLPEERYRLWSPNAHLETWVSSSSAGLRALDVACGCGREAVYLADLGYQVTAIDHLPDAVDLGRELERRYSNGPAIEWLCGDADAYEPDQGFDLITQFFFLDREVVRNAARWLRPGGSLVLETFTATHREQFGRPRREHLCLEPGELPTLVQGLELVFHEEGWHGGRHTARFVATRLR
jgi:tellurite methyltransferase